ncbi:MAG: RNA polymerase sigma factor [Longimicrobiales bacterium]
MRQVLAVTVAGHDCVLRLRGPLEAMRPAPAASVSSGTGPGGREVQDADVVRRVLAGETDLFAELVRRYGDVLYRHAERMTQRPDDAADLVQLAFVKGYRGLGRCDPERVGGWLFRILANLCRDFLKDRRRAQVPLDRAPVTLASTRDPESDLARGELGRRLQAALGRLTPEQREAFVLKHHEGYSYAEMAAMLGTREASLKMRVHRAREALKALLEEDDGRSDP